jgi:hypothetical protein
MFTRVEPQHAGPSALGILIPQGAKTPVIVRPRGLEWDLLPARWDGDSAHAPQFCLFTRDEAAGAARRFVQALEAAVKKGVNPLETFGTAQRDRVQLWLRTDEFLWIVCRRLQGQTYQPMTFASVEEAELVAAKLAAFVFPDAGVNQQYYFNTQRFTLAPDG